jgi:hypothetical protein
MDKDASGLSLFLYAIFCAGFYRKAIASEKLFLISFPDASSQSTELVCQNGYGLPYSLSFSVSSSSLFPSFRFSDQK